MIALNSIKSQVSVSDSLIDVIFNLVAETNAVIELPRLDDKDSTGLEAEILDFLFGRPLIETLKNFGLKVQKKGRQTILSPTHIG